MAVFLLGSTVGAQDVRAGFSVDTPKDTVDAVPGDGACADSKGRCSLRAAVHVPEVGSPAFNNGAGAGCPPVDQRGIDRPAADSECDSGAIEGTASLSLLVNGSFEDADGDKLPDGFRGGN